MGTSVERGHLGTFHIKTKWLSETDASYMFFFRQVIVAVCYNKYTAALMNSMDKELFH